MFYKNGILRGKDVKETFGTDWRNINFDNEEISLEECDLRDITLPEDTEFFQKIHKKSLIGARLPEKDYNMYNFTGVYLSYTLFTKESKLPLDTELFQKLGNRFLRGTVLPRGDYRLYNFKGLCLHGKQFTFDSFLPEYKEFLIDLGSCLHEGEVIGGKTFSLTENILRNINSYDLSGVAVNLKKYSGYISEKQLNVIRIKYKERIGKSIILPEMGLFKENSHALNNDKSLII